MTLRLRLNMQGKGIRKTMLYKNKEKAVTGTSTSIFTFLVSFLSMFSYKSFAQALQLILVELNMGVSILKVIGRTAEIKSSIFY